MEKKKRKKVYNSLEISSFLYNPSCQNIQAYISYTSFHNKLNLLTKLKMLIIKEKQSEKNK